jgi:hypothetical protein
MKHAIALCFFLSVSFSALLAQSKTQTTRSLPAFDKIGISGGFDKLVLKEGASEMVTIESEGVDPDKIKTEVKNGALEISMKNGSYNNMRATLVVTYRSLKQISSAGSTDIVTESTLKSDKFGIATSGSGDVRASLDVRKLEVAIAGSSDMVLKGSADVQEFAISGSGDIDASALKGTKADVAVSGSGDVKLNINGPVHTSVSGSGDVTNNN